jgi:large subunit ribosomal protein L30
MSPKKEETKKDPVASLEELEKTVALRPKKAKPAAGEEKPVRAEASPAAREAAPAAPKAKAKPEPAAAPIKVRLVKSGICTPKDQKLTLLGLGLRRLNQEVVRPDTPSIRGMLHKVRHLVEVSEAKQERP